MSNNKNRDTIIIGSRKSQLAMVQTESVMKSLQELHPNLKFEIKTMDTVGDRVLNVALSKIGDKGLFTKELEDLMLSGHIDIAVHSLKDLPTKFPEGLSLGAITKRENCFDAFIAHPKYGKDARLSSMPEGAVIGSSSLRRVSQLKRAYPQLQFKDIRGNLNTRFNKLETSGEYDGMILAVAGLERLGWTDRITEVLQPEVSLYAVGQGALGIECRSDDEFVQSLLAPLNHYETAQCCAAERAMLRELEGGCHVPIGVNTTLEQNNSILSIEGVVLSLDGTKSIRLSHRGEIDQPEIVGKQLALMLKEKGATEILAELAATVQNS
ncbi:porphobilinogen deaminase [Heterostelium album PN500]|uniref:Porphobilinogen deaminase n=1 Tax=Heterostelium pallidum (strain ATCC 26659 / Pp 5 / PN500) TaxID=670386 RepID=D3BM56_HETP5|nr:porphobilinogen deaminase [Heterostelium album PN500]EFA77657.1 porphobilinogen deaminase [Heterostelium album PN500]|eukprot:XP_020429785.1 porphobilinogen deaminase [Heterostelium album PN500]